MTEHDKALIDRAREERAPEFWSESDWDRLTALATRGAELEALRKRIRSEAFEEAAKIAMAYGETVNNDEWSITHAAAGVNVAAAIRALASRREE